MFSTWKWKKVVILYSLFLLRSKSSPANYSGILNTFLRYELYQWIVSIWRMTTVVVALEIVIRNKHFHFQGFNEDF